MARPSVAAYLERIGIERDAAAGPADLALLARVQLAHLVTVPFENLHVVGRCGVRTDHDRSLPKVVDGRRGGWCFELNGACSWLLRSLGFAVDLVSCRVWTPGTDPEAPDSLGPDLDHLALVVHLDGERWLVDVGFGDNTLHPLPLVDGDVPDARPYPVRIERRAGAFRLWSLLPTESGTTEWELQYETTADPRELEDFSARSTFLQTDPGSAWHQKPFATKALDGVRARVTLRRDQLRVRDDAGTVSATPVSPEEWPDVLAREFGLTLPA